MTSVGPPQCLGCGYLLEHLSARRCPECGRPFDAADPSTFHRAARGADAAMAMGLLAAVGMLLLPLPVRLLAWVLAGAPWSGWCAAAYAGAVGAALAACGTWILGPRRAAAVGGAMVPAVALTAALSGADGPAALWIGLVAGPATGVGITLLLRRS